jgi:hypothetical protein
MAYSIHCSPLNTISDDIITFLNGSQIHNLLDFVAIREEAIAYVVGCFYGVGQGVDYSIDEQNQNKQRFWLDFI